MISNDIILNLFDDWNKALQTGNPDEVVKLYDKNAILLPTLSPQVRHSHEEIKDYFVHFLAKKPIGKINESNIRILVIWLLIQGYILLILRMVVLRKQDLLMFIKK